MVVSFGIGSKFMSHGGIIFNGEMHQVKEHERTALVEGETYIIFDHPESLIRPFAPTANKWVEGVMRD